MVANNLKIEAVCFVQGRIKHSLWNSLTKKIKSEYDHILKSNHQFKKYKGEINMLNNITGMQWVKSRMQEILQHKWVVPSTINCKENKEVEDESVG